MLGRSVLVAIFLALIAAAPVRAANITAADWGTTAKGEKVQLFTLKGAGGLEADISNFGGVIVKLMVPRTWVPGPTRKTEADNSRTARTKT